MSARIAAAARLPALVGAITTLLLAGLVRLVSAQDVGVVKVSSGEVRLDRGGQQGPAPVGTKIRPADVVRTGPDGKVGITFADDSLLSAGPDTVLVIERFVYDATTHEGVFDAGLSRGTLAGVSGKIVRQTPGAMRVRTPSAILGVRGTEFLIRATGEGAAGGGVGGVTDSP